MVDLIEEASIWRSLSCGHCLAPRRATADQMASRLVRVERSARSGSSTALRCPFACSGNRHAGSCAL